MAYSSTNPPQIILQSMSGPNVYAYHSTHDSSDCAVTGFFEGIGAASRGNYNLGAAVGDIFFTVASTGATQPGEVILHSVIAATADQASTASATGWNAGYNVTISAT